MTPAFHRISNSQATAERLRTLFAESRRTGQRTEAVRAARWIVEELERTPLEFGESRFTLQHLELHMRLGFARPLRVYFGVHEPSRTVFVSWSGLGKG